MARTRQSLDQPMQPPSGDHAYNAGDPEQVKKRRAQSSRRKAETEDVIKGLLATVSGRRWLWQQLEFCHVFSMSYDPTSDRNTAFREGERNVGQRILADIMRADPNGYVRMLKDFGAKRGDADAR